MALGSNTNLPQLGEMRYFVANDLPAPPPVPFPDPPPVPDPDPDPEPDPEPDPAVVPVPALDEAELGSLGD